MSKIVLITGATSGIGEASALKFASAGWDVIITGRREDRLLKLESKIRKQYGVDVLSLCFDIRYLNTVKKYIAMLKGKWKNIAVLLNNAGLALGTEPFQSANQKDWEQMIDTNIKGLLYISRELAPIMIENGHGHIINLCSMAGHEVYPGGHVYCATKHAVLALTKGMRIDMVQHGIKVSAVSPGAVETEFSMVRYKGDLNKVEDKYDGYVPLTAKDIAESVFFIANQPAHVNIEEIYLCPQAQASPFLIHRE